MSVSTIEYTVSADLFADIDTDGLMQEASAHAFQIELRERLRDAFPKANVFLKWNPNRTGAADVFTIPEVETEQTRVVEIAEAVHADRTAWLRYDRPGSASS
ncbi:MAG: hypothetical protein H6719_32285 [Sandaracinaceae bacterium]|nr:hypothetical protein [Sandaracinaceae bacterium]